MSTVKRTAFWMTILQLPVILIAGISTYFVVAKVEGFNQDINIGEYWKITVCINHSLCLGFTNEELRYITIYVIPSLFLVSLVSILGMCDIKYL